MKLVEEDRIKTYKLNEISRLDNINYRTIKAHKEKYFPIRVQDSVSMSQYKSGKKANPFVVRYIRLKDIQRYVKKNTGLELIFK